MSRMSSGDSSKFSDPDASAVLEFWFGDSNDPENVKKRGKLWFAATPEEDEMIRERFGALHARARAGELDHWTGSPQTTLALVVLLDQFTRNLYRGSASAFANDARVLAISRSAIERGDDRALAPVERAFLYMPFQHSEDPDDQERSLQLYQSLLEESPTSLKSFAENTRDYAALHRDIVARFGRFPHRNALLGRASTEAEEKYLDEGGQRFGQG